MRNALGCAVIGVAMLAASLVANAPKAEPVDGKSVSNVLYVGKPEEPGGQAYVTFLEDHFETVVAVDRDDWDHSLAQAADVVLLDWPQQAMLKWDEFDPKTSETSMPEQNTELQYPLGDRGSWDRPTVLLGDTSLTVSAAWQTKGGSGCTCLDPFLWQSDALAWQHPIFNKPRAVDTETSVRVLVTPGWRKSAELGGIGDDGRVAMVPLVDTSPDENYEAGWATHNTRLLGPDGEPEPEIELISGGQNTQTTTSLAIYRQGNLLTFGIAQTPDQLNKAGRDLLENSIHYIANYSEDRPITHTANKFMDQDWPRSAGALHRLAESTKVTPEQVDGYARRFLFLSAADTVNKTKPITQPTLQAWLAKHGRYLRPSPVGKLDVDRQAMKLELPTDGDFAFFDRAIELLETEHEQAARAMLVRDCPEGPGENATAEQWQTWVNEHRSYLFFSQHGGWRWYVDPLAKARGVHTAELRGRDRADALQTAGR